MLKSFPLIHPRAAAVRRAMNLAPFQRVKHEPRGRGDLCYWNVDDEVQRAGGSPIYGWSIVQIPRHLVIAEHHAVWKDPSGQLIDVTQNIYGEPRITFAPDASIVPDLDRPNIIDLKSFVLQSSPEVTEFLAANQAVLDARRATLSDILGAGVVFRRGEMVTSHETNFEIANAIRAKMAPLEQRYGAATQALRALL